MMKYLALLIVTLIAMLIAVPIIATATELPEPAPGEEIVEIIPEDSPVVQTAAEEAQDTDPGGVQIDLTAMFSALWSVIMLIVARYVVPAIRARLSTERLASFDYWTKIAVAAAEKAYGAGRGTEKLAYADEILKSKGFTIDPAVVDAAIMELFENAKKSETT